MALKATIYKANLSIADLDRQVYFDTSLTLARHPSETETRLMLRLAAWLCHADERLQFTRGLCADDEPEIWLLNDHQGIECWIELGLPDEKRLKKASHRSAAVWLYAYSARAATVWWQQHRDKLVQLSNLTVRYLDDEQLEKLTALAARNMNLQATVQDGVLWLSAEDQHVELHFTEWQQVNQSA